MSYGRTVPVLGAVPWPARPRVLIATHPPVRMQRADELWADVAAMTFWRGNRRVSPFGKTSRPPRVTFLFLTALAATAPGEADVADLVDAAYCDDRDGGPIDPNHALRSLWGSSVRHYAPLLGMRRCPRRHGFGYSVQFMVDGDGNADGSA